VTALALTSPKAVYEHPEVFDGFRFSRMREERADARGGQEPNIFTHHMVTTSPNHIVYGHGRHACSGRYENCIIPPVLALTL
jgi:cytochrome P450